MPYFSIRGKANIGATAAPTFQAVMAQKEFGKLASLMVYWALIWAAAGVMEVAFRPTMRVM